MTRAGAPTFMGHPKGLFYLAFTEAWERFSYYGMTALLALFMVNQLLLPGHVEHIGGFSGFRAAVESVVGPLSTQALASQVFGLYSGFVIFSTAINIGAVAGPLLCGVLAQVYGWHYGFGIAAIFMLLGLATYLYGYRYLPARVGRRKFEGTRLSAAERRIVYALIVVMIITIFQSTAFYQVFNVNPIWIQQHVALDVGGFRIPVPWFQSINSISSVLCVPLVCWI